MAFKLLLGLAKRKTLIGAGALAAALAVTMAPASAEDAEMKGGAMVKWSYEGETGPDKWGELSPQYLWCSRGRMQSPVDLKDPEPAEMAGIKFDYQVTPLSVLNDGHTIQVNYAKGSSMTVGGRKFMLKTISFHTRSEHTVDGHSFPMEIHFMHESARGEMAVVAVLVEQGDENLGAREIWQHLPQKTQLEQEFANILVNGRDMLPGKQGYYRYMGSLTAPPCTEGVNWFVLKNPIQFSAEQIQAMAAILGSNARPVQPRNNRIMLDALVRE